MGDVHQHAWCWGPHPAGYWGPEWSSPSKVDQGPVELTWFAGADKELTQQVYQGPV